MFHSWFLVGPYEPNRHKTEEALGQLLADGHIDVVRDDAGQVEQNIEDWLLGCGVLRVHGCARGLWKNASPSRPKYEH